ncbi:putative ANTH domain, ENTH domain, phosphoinositide-binding clathrin adaptor, domain 2 [Helianthus annuus]|uniref:ANTH domain, phosphoinositide-binding clathrin adaptor, domain 2 n=1 Tax=Helianthus annuus TaxID=4232 RepID=A0A251TSI5_HELAN|nr:putative clathrin assembly protein At5g57200 [Helianthus annuus]KAF5789563.1 putative ANTH domain, phosphoinositide-binding clathrin adaptor, domain 2 [Helianthus annuus]KAJ0532901.1 putative ANTH domain, ENTH domain, phosphoinositide-binding clathrin adaptor, domain 2 [Helianthus annuus]KAJ0541294.1 putative ANTH domain, ENTH domain, ANTH domain superfamily protein [Helianthus annuus]KAJ0706375.1 putative ANTH domain, ENTH domain, ANTH domain superfamily protein [Helianthus annuus]KAJ08869
MGAFESFRKAYGALKDSTKVGLAKVNSEFKHLDVAIVKATNHVERPPKDRHVKKIISATSAVVPRADVAYCIHALYKRLLKTKNWIVAIKTLIVFHRILREGDPSFREELLNYSQRVQLFQISSFKDDSSPLAWDCSAWVRTYGMFLEERLECFRMLKYDMETECSTRRAPGKGYNRIRIMNGDELLEQLPAMQQLLYRLIGCQPEGAAYYNYLVQYALALVLKESFKIYCSINDGIINLVDLFFDMPKHEAVKALNIYKKAGKQAEYLAEFYDYCRHLDFASNFQFPMLRQPPPSFLVTMEEYIREAPSMGSIPLRRLEYEKIKEEESEDSNSKENDNEQVEDKEALLIECKPNPEPEPEFEPKKDKILPLVISQTNDNDLLGLSQLDPKALEREQNNTMVLGILQNGNDPQSSFTDWNGSKTTSGWELALVEKNININKSQSKLGGQIDKFLLDSLYQDDAVRKHIQLQNAGYNTSYKCNMQYNPFDQQLPQLPLQDPFMMSNRIAPPMNVQMAMLHQQQIQQSHYQYPHLYQQPYKQQNMLVLCNNQHAMGTSNPFGDVYEYPQSSKASHGNQGLV